MPEPSNFKLDLTERAYIGSLLQGYTEARGSGLSEKSFDSPLCGEVFALCEKLEAQHKAHDLVTVAELVDPEKTALLVEFAGEAFSSALVRQHENALRDRDKRREFLRLSAGMVAEAQDPKKPFENTLNTARTELDRISAGTGHQRSVNGNETLMRVLDQAANPGSVKRYPTGIAKLDGFLGGGLKGSRLIVIGARPGVGKSALLGQLALHAVSRRGMKILYISLEMSDEEIIQRMLACIGGVRMDAFETGKFSDEEMIVLTENAGIIQTENLQISEDLTTVEDIRREALKMRADKGLDMIFIDYLQLMRTPRKTSNRVEAVSEITRGLKLLSKELKIPIVAASQVNRASAGYNAERPPVISELRESGSIEQDADSIFLLHRVPDSEDREKRETMTVHLAKNRHGRTCTLDMLFDGEHMRVMPVVTK